MCFLKSFSFLLLLSSIFLFKDSFGQENSPASPSSSYSNKYYNKNQVKEEKNPIVIPRQNQIVVQGNTRLDSSVVIRDSLIDIDNTKPKDLSYAIKNLYKTGYFENVNIFKKDNTIFITVKENPLIDQISIEGIQN